MGPRRYLTRLLTDAFARTRVHDVAALGGLVILIAACASAPARQSAACSGERVLVVGNNTRTEVDVFARAERREWLLGLAQPGRIEFSLEGIPQNAYFLARRDNIPVTTMSSNGAAARAVEFRVECR